MKKYYIILIACFLTSTSLYAQKRDYNAPKPVKTKQTVVERGVMASLFESFELDVPPAGWTGQSHCQSKIL